MRAANRLSSLVILGVIFVTGSRAAGAAEYRKVLPGLANSFGANGTRFESSVWITNLGSSTTQIELGFIPFSGTAAPTAQVRVLSRGETLRLNNALLELFGLDRTAGTLAARADQPFDLRAVTANVANPSGTYGLSLESVSSQNTLTAGQAGHAIWLSHGADLSRGSRTNVTVALLAPNSQVTLSVYDATGVLRGLQLISSDTPGTWQASTSQLANDPEIPIGRVKFAVTEGEATGYASVVDNVTGDGLVAQAEKVVAGAADLLLNGVARTPGANNTRFVSDVRLFNPNEVQQTVTIEALGFAGGPRTISRSLGPNALLEIVDVLGPSGFDFPDGVAGALRLRAPLPLLAAARTRNVDPTGPGTFSTFQRAVVYDSGFATPVQPTTLTGLNQTSDIPGFRSNIALFGGNEGAAGTLRLANRFGIEVATAPFNLQASQWLQQRITGWFPSAEIPGDARVDISLASGSVHGYAAVVDNFTGDGVVVAAIRLSNAPPAAASRLIFSAVPTAVSAGSSFSVTVQAVRADNSVDDTFSGAIQVSVADGPGSLEGTNSRTASGGIASFSSLSLSAAGTYTLAAKASGFTAAMSGSIEVTTAAPSAIKVGTFSGQNGYTTAGTLQIQRANNGSETLELNSDFRVSSGAGSVSIWLARSGGDLNTDASIRLGTLTSRFSGEFRFPIPQAGSAGFTHVITYCDAFRVNFGFAELRNP